MKIQNDRDIYFPNDELRRTIITQTKEHILQAVLGIDFDVIGIIDHKTNESFGGTIDKELLEPLKSICNAAGLTNRRGGEHTVQSPAFMLREINPLKSVSALLGLNEVMLLRVQKLRLIPARRWIETLNIIDE